MFISPTPSHLDSKRFFQSIDETNPSLLYIFQEVWQTVRDNKRAVETAAKASRGQQHEQASTHHSICCRWPYHSNVPLFAAYVRAVQWSLVFQGLLLYPR